MFVKVNVTDETQGIQGVIRVAPIVVHAAGASNDWRRRFDGVFVEVGGGGRSMAKISVITDMDCNLIYEWERTCKKQMFYQQRRKQ